MSNNENDSYYLIEGGQPVTGNIKCLGAKNFATKAMVAALLGDSPTTLTNVPPIGDIGITKEMLNAIGVKIETPANSPNTLIIDPSHIDTSTVPTPHSGSNRIPILLLGALLHRCEQVYVPSPGGCKIGVRNVDFHLEAITQFGGIVEEKEGGYLAKKTKSLKGAHIHLPYPSVGATETCLFLGATAEGRTVITNAAIEPEIMELITMLRFMGAIIFTSPAREIRIDGVKNLFGTRIKILGDRIDAASWACLACASKGEITVEDIRPEMLGNFLSFYSQVGGGFELVKDDCIKFFRKLNKLRPAVIETDVYPGFSTDWQQPFAILLTQAEGISVIHETVYENRFGYLKALNDLGADTQVTTQCLGVTECRYKDKGFEHSAIIIGGRNPLKAVESILIPDLRAGLAYIIAAAIAEGKTKVRGIHFLERGYGDLMYRINEKKLNLNIQRFPS